MRLRDRLTRSGLRLIDVLKPKGEVVQIFLKKNGEAVAAVYSDDKREIRSPSLERAHAERPR